MLKRSSLALPRLVDAQKAKGLLREVEHGIVGEQSPSNPSAEDHVHEARGHQQTCSKSLKEIR